MHQNLQAARAAETLLECVSCRMCALTRIESYRVHMSVNKVKCTKRIIYQFLFMLCLWFCVYVDCNPTIPAYHNLA